MSSVRRRDPNKLAELAVAIASGVAVSAFAKKQGIAERTAYHWSALPEVKAQVRQIRQQLTDQAVGRLVSMASGAVVQIGRLAAAAESEAVRLAAARAVLSELVAIGSYAELAREIDAIKLELAARKESA